MTRRSDERRRHRACERKNQYPSERAARRAARWFRKHEGQRYGAPDSTLKHYRCEYGSHWHIGHDRFG